MSDDEDRKCNIQELNLERVKVISALGRGAKGVVFLVVDDETGEFWAMKAISRDFVEKKIHDGSEYRRVFFEQRVLSSFNHPLLPRLRGVLVTDKIVGYAIDYCPGRDLNCLRKKQSEKMFSDELIRFYAAEMVHALEYLHNQGIVYRDLKPENIMIQENGHIMLVDFDLSTKLSSKSRQSSPNHSCLNTTTPDSPGQKHLFVGCDPVIPPADSTSCAGYSSNYSSRTDSDSTEKSNSFVGTEEYVAPEIVSGNGHDFAVDWWSLGVVLYEMLYGRTPFMGSNKKETFCRILKKQPDLAGEATPLRDLIGKLLEKDPKHRMGLDGIKRHDFFRGVDWDWVVQITRPPYIPLNEQHRGDTEGNNNIDVELFVQEVFGADKLKLSHKINDSHDTETFLVF